MIGSARTSTSWWPWPGPITSTTKRPPGVVRRRTTRRGWATCPVTQSGFVRVSSNRKVVPAAWRPGQAILLLREMTSGGGHVFWADDTSIARSRWVAAERLKGFTARRRDAHLVALCLERKGCLVTFDGGVAHVLPKGIDADAVLTKLRA